MPSFDSAHLLLGDALVALATGYVCFAFCTVLAGTRGAKRRARPPANPRSVSILKPLCGDEPCLYENLRSFCVQTHPHYEILFGVRQANDPAIAVVRRLQAEFPRLALVLIIDGRTYGCNLKASSLVNLLPHARHDWLVVADSDIRVEPDYLERVTAPLGDSEVGIVTCLYHGVPRAGAWSRLGALFIDDWFAPSVHVSRALGSTRFSFGATIALRRSVLTAVGGFNTLTDVLADDYWLGELTRGRGLKTVLSDVVVATDVIEGSFATLWAHELRWLRTIRGAAPIGFALSFPTFTFPVLAAGLALAPTTAALAVAGLGLAARVALHVCQRRRRGDHASPREFLLLPGRDALSLVEWAAAHCGSRVSWRGRTLEASVDRRRLGAGGAACLPAFARHGLIVTADDFGLHPTVNEAVEMAHRNGVLTAASLMVGAPAAADAVARARRLPRLRVGLHLVLADGMATLPRARIPDLVDASGRFGDCMVKDGFRFCFQPGVRRQLEEEIRAQFEAYAATGLTLDHVNAHKHFHLHPTVLSLILRIGRDYGLRAMRLPAEADAPALLRPWLRLLARRLDAAGIAHNDTVVGLAHSGRMNERVMLAALRQLPRGVTEIYLHPATVSGGVTAAMADYRHADELAALLSPRVRAAVEGSGAPLGGFADVFDLAA